MADEIGLSRCRQRKFLSDMNVVPYIDIMLVLLVIFMVTAQRAPPGTIDLPTAGRGNAKPEAYVSVQVSVDGKFRVAQVGSSTQSREGLAVAMSGLAAAVSQIENNAAAPLPIVISADRSVSYGKVVQAMSELQKHHSGVVALMIKPE